MLKGKTRRKKPNIVIHDTIEIPPELKMAQYKVTLCINGCYVNQMVFLHSISERIHYRTTQWIPDREMGTYQQALEIIFQVYQRAGFKIAYVHADQEFDSVLETMRNEFLFQKNIASANELVPTVERMQHDSWKPVQSATMDPT